MRYTMRYTMRYSRNALFEVEMSLIMVRYSALQCVTPYFIKRIYNILFIKIGVTHRNAP